MSQSNKKSVSAEIDHEPSGLEDIDEFSRTLAPDPSHAQAPENPDDTVGGASTASAFVALVPEASASTPPNAGNPDKPASAQDTQQADWLGKVLGHFKLKSLLGEGSMGIVFEAQDIHLKRTVALKILRRRIVGTSDNDRVTMFLREARAAAAINHPNIVQIHEIANLQGWWCLAMEFLDAGNLHSLTKSSGSLPHNRFCSVFADAALGLNEAHDAGIIHRDVKPQNLMLTRKGRCKVTDFGLVKFDDPNDLFHINSRAVGTPQYLAPEIMLRKPATGASDVYSLGCAMYFCLAGRPPYLTSDRKEYYNLHLNSPTPDVRALAPGTPESIALLIMRAMAKRPSERPTALQIAQTLTTEMAAAGIDLNSTLTGPMASGQFPAITLPDTQTTRTGHTPLPPTVSASTAPSASNPAPSLPTLAAMSDPAIEARNRKLLIGASALLAVSLSVLSGAVWMVTRTPAPAPKTTATNADPALTAANQVQALLDEAAALAASVAQSSQEPGIAVPYAEFLQIKAQAEQEIRQGRPDRAQNLTGPLLEKANALVLLDAQRQRALSVAKTANDAGNAATQAGAHREAVEQMSKASQSDAQAQRAYALGDFATAQTAWNNAATQYSLAQSQAAAWTAFRDQRQSLAATMASANARLAPQALQNAQSLLDQANQAAQKQDPSAAADLLRKASSSLDAAIATARLAKSQSDAQEAAQLQSKLSALLAAARQNDSPERGKAALASLDELLKLAPSHPDALQLQQKIKAYYTLKPGQTTTNSIKMALAYIPPGEFILGSPVSEPGRKDDERQHKVKITRPFFMGVTEVTQAQWFQVMGKDYKSPDGTHPDDLRGNRFLGDDLPADGISYQEAVDFCTRLSALENKKYRLPTEAEWEYAARAGSSEAFNTGTALTSQQANIDGYEPYPGVPRSLSRMKPLLVGTFAPNAWGLKDMHGNVMEWTSDFYAAYPVTDMTDPATTEFSGPPEQAARVLRGGSWKHYASLARSANRSFYSPVLKANYIGFRIVLETE
jgi:formylglycine-generating enzyme required for sulfatase activity/serine/threonine protein kinase